MQNYYNSTFKVKPGAKGLKRSSFKKKPYILKRSTKPLAKRSKRALGRLWGLARADDEFSLEIRQRDGRCLFPGCQQTDIKKLQCSHWNGRRHNATRFDPDNCITLCMYHHFGSKDLGFEYQKQRKEKHGYDGQYTLFMQRWLGEYKYNLLLLRCEQSEKSSNAILELMARHGALSVIK